MPNVIDDTANLTKRILHHAVYSVGTAVLAERFDTEEDVDEFIASSANKSPSSESTDYSTSEPSDDSLIEDLPFESPESSSEDLLPKEYECGVQFDNRIFGGDIANLADFPW